MKLAVERIITAKLLNAGQTCVAPDYVLLLAGLEEEFDRLARAIAIKLYPRLQGNPDYKHIVSDAHHARMLHLTSDAMPKDARVVTLASVDAVSTTRIVESTLVFRPTPDLAIM